MKCEKEGFQLYFEEFLIKFFKTICLQIKSFQIILKALWLSCSQVNIKKTFKKTLDLILYYIN